MTERATIVLRPKRPRIVASAEEWKELRRLLWKRCAGKCEDGCGRVAVDAAHIVARSRGGGDVLGNLKAKCRSCHDAERGIRTYDAYTTLGEIAKRGKR